jgi:hypothetical protein
MKCPKLVTGFAMAFLILMAVQVFALKPKSGQYRIIQPEDAVLVQGGGATPGGISLSPTAAAAPVTAINITLSSVPYVTQYIPVGNNGSHTPSSEYYCGIASALMVRGKNKIGTSAPTLYLSGQKSNTSTINSNMQTIDYYLQNGQYGSYGSGSKQVSVLNNKGLLYIGIGTDEEQYKITESILKDVFTGIRRDITDGALNNGNVTSVTMAPMRAVIGPSDSATKAIWDHINNYNQPVVVVVDSNKQNPNNSNTLLPSSSIPTLHYIVIMGIREEGSGGTKRFSVYDPSNSRYPLEYTETNLRTLMDLPATWPQWVYSYGASKVGSPAYILKVQGK